MEEEVTILLESLVDIVREKVAKHVNLSREEFDSKMGVTVTLLNRTNGSISSYGNIHPEILSSHWMKTTIDSTSFTKLGMMN